MKAQVKFIRSDNIVMTVGTGKDWRITDKEGIDYPSLSLFDDEDANGDGSLVEGKRVNARDILVRCKFTDIKRNAEVRDRAISFFNPKHSYKIYITYQGKERWIQGELQGFSCPSENMYRPLVMTVKMLCHDPYFKSVDNFGSDIASMLGGFGFPYIQTDTIPVIPSSYAFSDKVVIYNDGDVETQAKAIITFTGNVTNPLLYKDESYVKIIDDFKQGDEVVIDFDQGTIRKNNIAIMQKIDRTSSFTNMVLDIGDSLIGYGADDGDNNMSVRFYYNKKYLGM